MNGPLWKEARGTALKAAKERSAKRRAHEQRAMQAALDRDGGGKGKRKCRVPTCACRSRKYAIDPVHITQPDGTKHRGMGGDKTGARTDRRWIVSMCRISHGLYDGVDSPIRIVAHDDRLGADGTLDWYLRSEKTGEWLGYTEQRIGVSVRRTKG